MLGMPHGGSRATGGNEPLQEEWMMTHREKFIRCLERKPIEGHVPTFELEFFLTMESFGKLHPSHRIFRQWDQMSESEQRLHIKDIADTYLQFARKYDHSAIFVQSNAHDVAGTCRLLEEIREQSGDEYYLMLHGDPTLGIPNGDGLVEFSVRLYEESDEVLAECRQRVVDMARVAESYAARPGLLDGFTLCSDYCFNDNPFMSPDMFSEFVTPFLKDIVAAYRDMGFYVIKHTDGNIMPIVDQLVECNPHALHSLDPQGGVDLAKVKRLYGDKVCLIGNVNCALLQTGTEEECVADVRRSLRDGMPGFGYIFSTSNCAYTGLALERYELMNRIWREEGVYPALSETEQA
jgi:uroporphyrinogen decarboxylase